MVLARRIQNNILLLRDIGLLRLLFRLSYDFKIYLRGNFFFRPFYLLLFRFLTPPPFLLKINSPRSPTLAPGIFTFSINNITFSFPETFVWSSSSWPRLWQFSLHYFDWLHDINSSSAQSSSTLSSELIDRWIDSNPVGKGDAWHSYTISLRLRNLLKFYDKNPDEVTYLRVQSLWHQYLFLHHHVESCNGGNHLLENLISLTYVPLYFTDSTSRTLFRSSLARLKLELNQQILEDGCHVERSFAYHLLLLNSLLDLLQLFRRHSISDPVLSQFVFIMFRWSCLVSGPYHIHPPFNDSATDSNVNLSSITCKLSSLFPTYLSIPNNQPLSLPDTGWHILRDPQSTWQIYLKNGHSSPQYLPAHVHSDQLSFNLYAAEEPLLIECGTSLYGNGTQRQFERSQRAHNTLQFSRKIKNRYVPFESPSCFSAFRAVKHPSRFLTEYRSGHSYHLLSATNQSYISKSLRHIRHIALLFSGGTSSVLILDEFLPFTEVFATSYLHFASDHVLGSIFLKVSLNGAPLSSKSTTSTISSSFNNRNLRPALTYSFGPSHDQPSYLLTTLSSSPMSASVEHCSSHLLVHCSLLSDPIRIPSML